MWLILATVGWRERMRTLILFCPHGSHLNSGYTDKGKIFIRFHNPTEIPYIHQMN